MRTAAFHIGDPKGAVERACGLGCGRGARGGPPVHRKIIFQVRRVLDLKGKFGKKKKVLGMEVKKVVLVSCSCPSYIGGDGRGCAWTGPPCECMQCVSSWKPLGISVRARALRV